MQIKYVFANYPIEIVLSEKRRKTYYSKTDNIPKRLQNDRYVFKVKTTSKGKPELLYDIIDRVFVIKNANSADKPRTYRINGQKLHDLSILPAWRSMILSLLKNYFISVMVKQNKALNITRQQLQELHAARTRPLTVGFTFYNVDDSQDLDNHSLFYQKTFLDCLSNTIIKKKEGETVYIDNPAGFMDSDNIYNINGFSIQFIKLEPDSRIQRYLEITLNFSTT